MRKILCLCALALFVACKSVSVAPVMEYTVTVTDPARPYLDVALDCSSLTGESTLLKMPVWAPGYYIILDYPKNVFDFEATDTQGNALEWKKVGKTGWEISHPQSESLHIEYRVKLDGRSVAESFMDSTALFLATNGVFMYPEGEVMDGHPDASAPVKVRFTPYPGWANLCTGLAPDADAVDSAKGLAFCAPSFDVLYDSPFYWGNQPVRTFEHEGHSYLVSLADTGDIVVNTLIEDLKKVITQATLMMKDVPYSNYAFLFMGEGGGGLEHINSQASFLGGYPSSNPQNYRRLLCFIAHEYFHCYNVKTIRPFELGPFDYDKECFTNSLWLSEGGTVYYEYILCLRAGLISKEDFRQFMSEDIRGFERHQGKYHMTLAQSSYDTWLHFFDWGAESKKTTISYYQKGSVVSYFWDLALRHVSQDKCSLDDVMRLLYNRYYKEKGRGFTEEELNLTLKEVMSSAATSAEEAQELYDLLMDYIYTTCDMDYDKFLAFDSLEWDTDTDWIVEK